MTDQEINRAIAEHLGWKLYKFTWGGQSWTAMRPPGDAPESGGDSEVVEVSRDREGLPPFTGDNIPNYAGDLNAMNEAEEALSDKEHDRFRSELWLMMVKISKPSERALVERRVHSAKARQRAEAFLRTVGKWEENE